MVFSEILRKGGRIDHPTLVRFAGDSDIETFANVLVHPLFVGKALYEGDLTKGGGDDGGGSSTMMFNPAEMTQPDPSADGGGEKDLSVGLSHAIYSLHKDGENAPQFMVSIGRTSENDLVMPDYSISRTHAHVMAKDGKYYLKDGGSTNGTSFNGAAVEGSKIIELTSKADVSFGRYSFLFLTPRDLYTVLT